METSATTIVVPPTAEEQRIASIADSINLADPSLTVTYGTEAMQGISRFADDLLSRVQAKDSGELGESLTNLMLKVKDVNVSEVMGSPGFLQSLPLVGSLFSSAKRTVAKFNTLSEQIEIIVDKLDEAMIGLLRDIETLEMLYEHNARFHAELTAYIEAGKRKLEEARTVELPRLKAQADASGDLMEAQQVRDLSEQINRFERRLHDLQLSRTITVQTAPQIRIIQSNNRTLAEKIQTSILATIPIWKSQMVLALSLHGQKNAAALQKTVSDTTNDMLRSNAELLEQAAVDTAREVERSVVDIETLREVHEKLIGTIEETLRIAQEGRERRAAAEKELAVMETELKDRLTSLAARKSREEIAADGTSETEKLFFQLERAEAVMEAFEHLNYRERAMVSAHLGFCMECYSIYYYDENDLDEDGKPQKKPRSKEAFIDIAIDHGLSSPDTADKTYRKALQKMKLELIKQEIY